MALDDCRVNTRFDQHDAIGRTLGSGNVFPMVFAKEKVQVDLEI